MTEPNVQTSPTGTDSSGTAIAPAVPSSLAPPSSSQPTTTTTPGLDPLIFSPDGKKWSDVAHGQRGHISQLRAEREELAGKLNAQIETLRGTVTEKEQSLSQLQAELQSRAKELEAVPALLDQIKELEQRASLADKYRMLAEYPRLLEIQVEETVPGEDGGEPKTIKVNPLLNLVENSNLTGDALRAEIRRMAAFYEGSRSQQEQRVQAPASPSPAAPVEETAEYWYKRANELRERMNTEGASDELFELHNQAWRKYAELSIRAG